MTRSRAALACLWCLGACPADPGFQRSDASTADDAADTTTPQDAADTAPLDAADTTPQEVAEITPSDADVDVELDPDVEVSACGDCGPGASCVVTACVCDRTLCDTQVNDDGASSLALTVLAPARPFVAYARRGELTAVRWDAAGWAPQPTLGVYDGDYLAAATDASARAVVLTRAGPTSTALVHWDDGERYEAVETGLPCHWGDIQRLGSEVFMGCVDRDAATFTLYAAGYAGDDFTPLGGPPLDIGDPLASDEVGDAVRWVVTGAGLAIVAFVHENAPGVFEAWVADKREADWEEHDLTVVAAAPGTVRPQLALALDGYGDPHVFIVHADDGGAPRVTQHIRDPQLGWHTRLVELPELPSSLVALEAATSVGGTVLLLSATSSGAHLRVRGTNPGGDLLARTLPYEAFDLTRADLALDAAGAPWVALLRSGGAVDLWRPAD